MAPSDNSKQCAGLTTSSRTNPLHYLVRNEDDIDESDPQKSAEACVARVIRFMEARRSTMQLRKQLRLQVGKTNPGDPAQAILRQQLVRLVGKIGRIDRQLRKMEHKLH